MSKSQTTILLLLVLTIAVRTEDCRSKVDQTIARCRRKAAAIQRKTREEESPPQQTLQFSGPPNRQNSEEATSQEDRQRVVECIADTFQRNSSCVLTLYEDQRFQDIVRACEDGKPKYRCDPSSPYRTYNGSCNNLDHPEWGSWTTCEERLFEPSYIGVAGFRRSVTGRPLPGARVVSLKYSHGQRITRAVSHLFTLFGQFVAHDITDTIVSSNNGAFIPCCQIPPEDRHPQCAPIKLPKWDPFYSKINKTCMDFVRSAPCDTCTLDKRHQINQVTSFLDCSMVYGSTKEINNAVREFQGGRLKTQEYNGVYGSLLPPISDNGICSFNKEERCFLAGDRRVNQHLSLSALHTLLLREHNRVVGLIESQYANLDNETIFQEARKFVTAEFESIVYNEFLPILVGEEIMKEFDLDCDGEYSSYDPQVNPTILSEFNTAGYRLHSLVHFIVSDELIDGSILRFMNSFTNAAPLYHDALGDILQGVGKTPSQLYDRFVVEDMTEFLYKPIDQKTGLDIVSANVQRGRDHGLPPYCQVLEYRTGKEITCFEDLEDYIEPEPLLKIEEIYRDPRDIDLWIGLLSEIRGPDDILGPTARFLVGEQFRRLKYGDRFFYTMAGQFSKDQLKALSSASFARLLCDNLKVEFVPRNPFLLGDITHCSDIPKVW